MRIAIIGAGWSGISCLRTFRDRGYQVDLFEKSNDIGGVWHPENCYAGLKIHTPAFAIEYFDFKLPSNVDPLERITSNQVFNYLQNYCNHFKLYLHMNFNCLVNKVIYNTHSCKSQLVIHEGEHIRNSDEYDFVIYTNGYSNRNLPDFLNLNSFSGKILHAFDANEHTLQKFIKENKKIIVLGGNKTATDLILQFYHYGYRVTWLYRKAYWFFCYNLRSRWLRKSRKKNLFYQFLFISGLLSSQISPKLTFYLWRWFRIIHTFDKSSHYNFKKFHFGMLDHNQLQTLKEYSSNNGIEGEIKQLLKKGILLTNGQQIEADVIICCTGSGPKKLELNIQIDNKILQTDLIKKIYRGRVIPEIPKLIFTGYHQFSMGTVDGLLQGNWVLKYIELNANTEYLVNHAEEYPYPFFSRPLLFDSHDYIINNAAKLFFPFFKYKELKIVPFVRWFLNSHFNGNKPIKPFDFSSPSSK